MAFVHVLPLLLSVFGSAPHDEGTEQSHFHYDRVAATVEARRVGGKELYDPDVAVVKGEVWLTWLKHVPGAGDQLWIGCQFRGKWRVRERIPGLGKALARPTLTLDRSGGLWLSVEAQASEAQWQVLAGLVVDREVVDRQVVDPQSVDRREGSAEKVVVELVPVSPPVGNAINHRAAPGVDRPSFVWQQQIEDRFDVAFRVWGGELERVSSSDSNDWQPDLCVDASGRTTVVWDGYRETYDVFLRRREVDGRWNDVLCLAEGPSFQARARVACGLDGSAWIVWEEGASGWGEAFVSVDKAWNNATENAGPLHRSRKLRMACLSADGSLGEVVGLPMPSLEHAMALGDRRPQARDLGVFYERAEITVDSEGRPWVAYRHYFETQLGSAEELEHHIEEGWRLYARCLRAEGWSPLVGVEIPQRDGMQRLSLEPAGDGVILVWDTGRTDRREARPGRGMLLAHVDSPGGAAPKFRPAEGERLPLAASKSGKRDSRPALGGMQLFFGDLHRHTDLSLCFPFFDGSLEDAYRYAIDVAGLDFLSVTDHMRDMDGGGAKSQLWWRSTKEVTRHRLGSRFFPFFGSERSHRDADHNVISLQPNILGDFRAPLPEFWAGLVDDAFTLPHTPFEGRVWDYHDEAKRPLAEIYQGLRDLDSVEHLHEGLGRGYRFGFVASSDHLSTNASFAGVWAPRAGAEEVFQALRMRRTYAATARIELAFRAGEAWMGEAFESASVPTFRFDIRGGAPIERVELYADGALVQTLTPAEALADWSGDLRPPGPEPADGEHWYYLRVVRVDGHRAWSSPIWVRYSS